MKKMIVIAATAIEIEPFITYLKTNYTMVSPTIFQNNRYTIDILITGVGMMNTAFSLGKCLSQQKFDGAIQAGIAGSFDTTISLGTLVAVKTEQYGDLGAEDYDDFLDIFELGFMNPDQFPFTQKKLENQKPLALNAGLPWVNSLSVNTVSGSIPTIAEKKKKYNCGIENMEGIAFHFACLEQEIPFVQIRAISNYVSPRNKSEWQIDLAIRNLNQYLIETFKAA
jgi:futalosine hydrolase